MGMVAGVLWACGLIHIPGSTAHCISFQMRLNPAYWWTKCKSWSAQTRSGTYMSQINFVLGVRIKIRAVGSQVNSRHVFFQVNDCFVYSLCLNPPMQCLPLRLRTTWQEHRVFAQLTGYANSPGDWHFAVLLHCILMLWQIYYVDVYVVLPARKAPRIQRRLPPHGQMSRVLLQWKSYRSPHYLRRATSLQCCTCTAAPCKEWLCLGDSESAKHNEQRDYYCSACKQNAVNHVGDTDIMPSWCFDRSKAATSFTIFKFPWMQCSCRWSFAQWHTRRWQGILFYMATIGGLCSVLRVE